MKFIRLMGPLGTVFALVLALAAPAAAAGNIAGVAGGMIEAGAGEWRMPWHGEGLKLPREACPSVRIKVMVITTVTSTIRVAPKLRASSLRSEEWNNIADQENLNYEL